MDGGWGGREDSALCCGKRLEHRELKIPNLCAHQLKFTFGEFMLLIRFLELSPRSLEILETSQ
jgi:hypothetical protein